MKRQVYVGSPEHSPYYRHKATTPVSPTLKHQRNSRSVLWEETLGGWPRRRFGGALPGASAGARTRARRPRPRPRSRARSRASRCAPGHTSLSVCPKCLESLSRPARSPAREIARALAVSFSSSSRSRPLSGAEALATLSARWAASRAARASCSRSSARWTLASSNRVSSSNRTCSVPNSSSAREITAAGSRVPAERCSQHGHSFSKSYEKRKTPPPEKRERDRDLFGKRWRAPDLSPARCHASLRSISRCVWGSVVRR